MKVHRPIPHGTLSAYTNDGCRCIPCKAAMTSYCRERRRRQRLAVAPSRRFVLRKVWAEPRLGVNERQERQACPVEGCGGLLAEETIGRAFRLLCTRCSWREWELVAS